MTFWRGKCLMFQFASEYIFFNFPIYLLNLYFSLSQPTCFPFSFVVQPLSRRSLLAIIKADVLYKGGKTDCFKLHELSSLTEKTGVGRAKFCMSLTVKKNQLTEELDKKRRVQLMPTSTFARALRSKVMKHIIITKQLFCPHLLVGFPLLSRFFALAFITLLGSNRQNDKYFCKKYQVMVSFLVCSRKGAKGRCRNVFTLCAKQLQMQLIVQKLFSAIFS